MEKTKSTNTKKLASDPMITTANKADAEKVRHRYCEGSEGKGSPGTSAKRY